MSDAPARPTLRVGAAVIEQDGRFLLTRRLAGSHLGGCWEFPGGKCDAGEDLDRCLAREIREELDADVVVGPEILETTHAYADRVVELHFFACRLAGRPRPMLGQQMRWVRREELTSLALPPADAELVQRLANDPAARRWTS